MTETCLTYNGVFLRNVQTLSLEETPVMDESGQQHIYNLVRLKVQGYFTKDNPRANAGRGASLGIWPNMGEPASANPKDQNGADRQFHFLSYFLNEPRKRLSYAVNYENSGSQNLLFSVLPGWVDLTADPIPQEEAAEPPLVGPQLPNLPLREMSGWHDLHGGPFPKNVSITQIANNMVFRVEFEVEFAIAPWCFKSTNSDQPVSTLIFGQDINPAVDINGQIKTEQDEREFGAHKKLGVLSNRWSCVDRLDNSSYLIRTYAGTVRLANPHWNPNDYRCLTLPPLVPGMRRESIEYRASEDGLKLQYTIVDKEVTITPPEGCSDIKIRHQEAAVDMGAKIEFNLQVSLRAEKDGSLYALHRIAAAIVESRLNLNIANATEFGTYVSRYDVTADQGSDEHFGLVVVVQGFRNKLDGDRDGIINAGLVNMSNRTLKRQANIPGTVMQDYYNQLAKGNRENEQPNYEGVVPAISALHAAISTRCTNAYGADASVDSSETAVDRYQRVIELQEWVNDYVVEDLFPGISVEILDELNDIRDPSFSSATYSNVYTDYRISSKYGSAGLIVQLPVAKTNTLTGFANAAFVSIGPVQQTRTVRVEAERVGANPRLPSPVAAFYSGSYGDGTYTNHKLLNMTVSHENPIPAPAGPNLVYTSRVEYIYGMDNVPTSHKLGIPDYMTASGSSSTTEQKAPYTRTLAEIFSAEWSLS